MPPLPRPRLGLDQIYRGVVHMRWHRLMIAVGAAMLVIAPAWAANDFSGVEITTTRVAEGIYMLQGAGGNMAVSVGKDGTFLIDDEFEPLGDKIRAAIHKLSPKPIRFVLNTHWHGDHTGGNLGMAEHGVIIIAQDNVRVRMKSEHFNKFFDSHTPPAPGEALPLVTFNDTVTFHMNGHDIKAFHVPPAHTDGDSVVYFPDANVIHTGDIFFNKRYPFIDVSSGGCIDGMIKDSGQILNMADEKTKIIPGHGPLGNKADLANYHHMLSVVRDRIKQAIEEGKTLEQVQAMQPTKEFDAVFGGGSIKPEKWVGMVYDDLARKTGC